VTAVAPVARRVRVGTVGLGQIFDLNRLGYRDNPDAELVALCDVDPTLVERRRTEFPAAQGFTDFERFLAADLDLVEILTPTHLHHEMVLKALDAGAHVSVQKPMAITLAEADEMIAAADAAHRHLRVFENYLFYEPLVVAKTIIESGEIGDPLMLHLKMVAGDGGWAIPPSALLWRSQQSAQGRGWLVWDDGHHKFSLMRWLFGPLDSITASIGETLTGGEDDMADVGVIDAPTTIMWRHSSGVRGLWDISYAPQMRMRSDYYAADERFEITGTVGYVRVNRGAGRPIGEPALVVYRDGITREYHDLDDDWASSFRDSTRHFIDVLKGRSTDLLWSGRDAREVLRTSLAAIQSSAANAPVLAGSMA